jgi:phenylalanyl-tRNA synthetase beta chain
MNAKKIENKYKEPSKFPPQIEDITIELPEKTYVGEVIKSVYGISNLVYRVELKDMFERNHTFNIQYQDPNKTLTDNEVEQIRNKILAKVKEKFGGQVKD